MAQVKCHRVVFFLYCACLSLLSLQICETTVDHICRIWLSSSTTTGYVCSPGYCLVCCPEVQHFQMDISLHSSPVVLTEM